MIMTELAWNALEVTNTPVAIQNELKTVNSEDIDLILILIAMACSIS